MDNAYGVFARNKYTKWAHSTASKSVDSGAETIADALEASNRNSFIGKAYGINAKDNLGQAFVFPGVTGAPETHE